MKNEKLEKAKQHVWAATATAISIYFSIVFAAGIIIGYLGTRLFGWKTGHKKVFFTFRGRQLHFHHWIMGGLALGGIAVFSSFQDCPRLILGSIGGIIVEDFKDMYQPILGWLKRQSFEKGIARLRQGFGGHKNG